MPDTGQQSEQRDQLFERLKALHALSSELTTLPDRDTICRMGVLGGAQQLGFDRLAIWFGEVDTPFIHGSYGIDENGNLRDERNARIAVVSSTPFYQVLTGQKRCDVFPKLPLLNHTGTVVGEGTLVLSSLWTGRKSVGVLCCDNLLSGKEFTDQDVELLQLYGMSLGHILYRMELDERYQAVVQNSIQGLCIYEDRKLIYVNPATEKMVGVPACRLEGMSLSALLEQLIDPEDHAMILKRQQDLEKGKQLTREFMFRLRAENKHKRWIRALSSKVTLNQKPARILSLLDVTDEVAVQAELLEANQQLQAATKQLEEKVAVRTQEVEERDFRYQFIAENAMDIICRGTVDGVYTYVSPGVKNMLGYEPEEWVGHSAYETIHPDDVPGVRPQHEEFVQNRGAQRITCRVRHKRGHYVWVEVNAQILQFPGAVEPEMLAIIRDVSSHVTAEEQLEQTVRERTKEIEEANRKLQEEVLARKRIEDDLRSRHKLLNIANKAAERFLLGEHWEENLKTVFNQIGEQEQLSRIYFMEDASEEGAEPTARLIAKWSSLDAPPDPNLWAYHHFRYKRLGFELWYQKLLNGEYIFKTIDSMSGRMKVFATVGCIKSVLIVPVVIRGRWLGGLILQDCSKKRIWRHEEVESMILVANVVGAAFARQRDEEKLLQYQQTLRSLASELLIVSERERRQLAADLHDSIGQLLAISNIKLDALARPDNANNEKTYMELKELLESAIKQTRSLTFALSPPALYEIGLEAAVDSWVDHVEKMYGLHISVHDDGKAKSLSDDKRALLFRSIQELLTNVVKHAEANKASVDLVKKDGAIEVRVTDDGKGIQPGLSNRQKKHDGYGLFSIRERLQAFGGRLDINTAPSGGTIATVLLPLD